MQFWLFGVWTNMVESVQRRFIWIAVRRLLRQSGATLPPYEVRCRMLGLMTPTIIDLLLKLCLLVVCFGMRLIVLHYLIELHCTHPLTFWSREFLLIPSRRTLYHSNDPFIQSLHRFNSASGELERWPRETNEIGESFGDDGERERHSDQFLDECWRERSWSVKHPEHPKHERAVKKKIKIKSTVERRLSG